MAIKLYSIERWKALAAGAAVQFEKPAEAARRVRLNVNVAAPTVFHIEDADGPRLLAAVPAGLETIEFSAAGKFAVFAAEGSGEVHYQVADEEPTAHRVVNPVVFTKLAQRRRRNPELEEMMFRMEQNINRRMESQRVEYEAALARMEAARVESQSGATPASAPVEPVSEPEPAEPEPGSDAGSADGGE